MAHGCAATLTALLLVTIACLGEAARRGALHGQVSVASGGPTSLEVFSSGEETARVVAGEDGRMFIVQSAELERAGEGPRLIGVSNADTIAEATYIPQERTRSNFGKLTIKTSGAFPDLVQMRAMGYVEGFLSAVAIHQNRLNQVTFLAQQTNKTGDIRAWLDVQREWTEAQIASRAGNGQDIFWDAQAYIWEQMRGIVEGYEARRAQEPHLHLEPLSFANLHWLNTMGDMDDLVTIVEHGITEDTPADSTDPMLTSSAPARAPARLHPRWDSMSPAQARAHIAKSGRCSALIKVSSDLKDIMLGHTTWYSYTSLARLYKHYQTALSNPAVAAQRLSFSSYPGLVHSLDDFMIASSGLVMTETSNDVYDLSLFRKSTNHGALSWQRARAASMLARNGAEFSHLIQTANSGTYNNQYMVVDLHRFSPGEQLQAGLLTVIETIPGNAYTTDATQLLELGYWPSYNIPFNPEVYNATGYPDVVARLRARGSAFNEVASGLSYQVAPRAKIFRRDAGDVNTLADIKRVLRSNGWSQGRNSDPFSPSPWDAICARGDLDPEAPDAYGCYDAKVTSYHLAMRMTAEAVNGPAWDGDGSRNGHPAFTWRRYKDLPHVGMIPVYNTVFEVQAP